jgi:hypothetical protein
MALVRDWLPGRFKLVSVMSTALAIDSFIDSNLLERTSLDDAAAASTSSLTVKSNANYAHTALRSDTNLCRTRPRILMRRSVHGCAPTPAIIRGASRRASAVSAASVSAERSPRHRTL